MCWYAQLPKRSSRSERAQPMWVDRTEIPIGPERRPMANLQNNKMKFHQEIVNQIHVAVRQNGKHANALTQHLHTLDPRQLLLLCSRYLCSKLNTFKEACSTMIMYFPSLRPALERQWDLCFQRTGCLIQTSQELVTNRWVLTSLWPSLNSTTSLHQLSQSALTTMQRQFRSR